MRSRYLVLLAVTACLPLACGRRQPESAGPERAQVPVKVVSVETGALRKTVCASGQIHALDDVLLSAKLGGKAAKVHVREGDRVKRGQILVQLEDKDARAARDQATAGVTAAEARRKQAKEGVGLQASQVETGVQQAEAALEAAQARLKQAQSGALMTSEAVQAQIAQAAAGVGAAQAGLDALRSGAREEEKRQADLAVQQAQANRDNAKSDYERSQTLFASGALSPQQMDAARTRYEVAEAQLNTALEAKRLVYQGPRSEQVRAAEEQLKQAQSAYDQALANARQNEIRGEEVAAARTAVTQAEAGLQLAKANEAQKRMRQSDLRVAEAGLEQANAALAQAEEAVAAMQIRAPVSGAVAMLEVEVGEMLAPGLPVIRVVTSGAVVFEGYVSEADVEQVKVGAPASVRVPAMNDAAFAGEVMKVLPAGDPESHAFLIKVALAGGGTLKPGMFAEAEIVLREVRDLPVIPLDAVLQSDGKMSVFLVGAGGAARGVDIVPELVVRDRLAVAAGLSPGDRLVVSGQRSLQEGDTVRIVEE